LESCKWLEIGTREKQARKCMHSIILLCSPELDLWPLNGSSNVQSFLVSMIYAWVWCLIPISLGDGIIMENSPLWLHGWLGIPQVSSPNAKMHIHLHVKYPLLLSYFNEYMNVLTNFNTTHQYQISWNSVQLFLSFYMHTDSMNNFNRRSTKLQMCVKKKVNCE
jgi:hypothetical protein